MHPHQLARLDREPKLCARIGAVEIALRQLTNFEEPIPDGVPMHPQRRRCALHLTVVPEVCGEAFDEAAPLDTCAGGRKLALECERYEPKLIVLDTISRFVEGKEDSADTWRNLYTHTMVPLRRQNRAVLRLDHQGHDSSKGARGSSAKRDDVDVAWILKRSGNNVTLIRDKGRSLAHPEKVTLRRHTNPTCHLPVVAEGKQAECVEALDRLKVPLHTSRDDAAKLLRDNGYKVRTGDVSPALKARLSSPSLGTDSGRDG
jgi:hypothetical protein